MVELVWISRGPAIVKWFRHKGYRAYWVWSSLGMYCSIRANVYVFDCFPKLLNSATT
jgi:hypothetical protein